MEKESMIYLLILKKNCMFCNISLRKSLKFASLFKISMTTSAKSNRMLIVDGMKNSLLQQKFLFAILRHCFTSCKCTAFPSRSRWNLCLFHVHVICIDCIKLSVGIGKCLLLVSSMLKVSPYQISLRNATRRSSSCVNDVIWGGAWGGASWNGAAFFPYSAPCTLFHSSLLCSQASRSLACLFLASSFRRFKNTRFWCASSVNLSPVDIDMVDLEKASNC